LRVPVHASDVMELTPEILSMKTECEREDLSLQLLAATRRFLARCIKLWIVSPFVTSSI
jgi:hypothetical protein